MRIGKHTYKHVKPLPYLLLAPVVVYLGFLVFYPFLRSIYLCFFVTNSLGVPKSFMGFGNFKRVFTDPAFLKSLVQTFKFSALLTGDLYESRELELVKKYGDLLDVDMLKIPHHGHVTYTSEQFVNATSSEVAVGMGHVLLSTNKYANLLKNGAKAVLMDMPDGYIHVWTDGKGDIMWETSRKRTMTNYERHDKAYSILNSK